MKTRGSIFKQDPIGAACARNRGFTLIELIGVLAILTILSSVVAPNVLRSIERAAVRAERESAHAIGEQLKLHLRDQGNPADPNNWAVEIAAYSEMSATDLVTNKRQMPRVMIYDPASAPSFERALILSSMRTNLNLPSNAQIRNNFQTIWDTPESEVPAATGWNAWNAVANGADFLVIERVNLLPIYRTELQSFTLTLNNISSAGGGGGSVSSYSIVFANGATQSATNIPVGSSVTLSPLRSKDIVRLYDLPSGASLAYTYVVSDSGRTFDFDGVDWLPK